MTGQNAARHRVTCWTLRKDKSPERGNKTLNPSHWNLNGLQPTGSNIPRSVAAPTLPQLLRDAGYRTIHAGKAHFGAAGTPGADPRNLGFDVNIAGHAAGGPGSYHGDKNFSAAWRRGDRIWDVPGLEKYHGQEINLTEAITREAITELERAVADKKPFYLYMSHYTVHAPWEADRRFIDGARKRGLKGQQATLASMLEGMDKSLGDLRAAIERLGVADNTIVVFMSDNGSPKQCPQNLPLRGHKITGYEGGTRVPMIVRWPGITRPAARTDNPILIEDIFPTFLTMADIPVPDDPAIDGHSFVPVLKNPAAPSSRPPLISHYPNLYDQPPYSSIRRGDWKLIYWHSNRKLELYTLTDDIGESTNLADKQPEKVGTLAKLLSDHLRETKAVMPIDKATNKPVPLPTPARR
jgi:arylsulfatase A-like enzyme